MAPRRRSSGGRKAAAAPRARARDPAPEQAAALSSAGEDVVLSDEEEESLEEVAADAAPAEEAGDGEATVVEGADLVAEGKEGDIVEEEDAEELEGVEDGASEEYMREGDGEETEDGAEVEEAEDDMDGEEDDVLESGMDEDHDQEESDEGNEDQVEMEAEGVLEKQKNTPNDGEGILVHDENRSAAEEDSEDNDEEVDPSAFMDVPFLERKKQKDFEIFVGGLDREAVEEDLKSVFGAFGEIIAARIVKHPVTQKSKGYGFIRFATVEQAKKVLDDLKDGVQVKDKKVKVSAGQDNDTLYVANICKTWSKELVLEKMKGYGLLSIEEIYLPEDPSSKGKNRGFALLEFSSHSDAMAAFKQLRKPDAIFGCDRSAKVAFAQSSMHPSEESLSQVKTVYIECLPDSWDEGKVKEHLQQYGQIEKIQLSKNFTVSTTRKDFGFVTFDSRESAVACVDGINKSDIGDGDKKLNAQLARPQNKGRLVKQGARGGYRIRKDVKEKSQFDKAKTASKSKAFEAKGSGRGSFRGGKGGRGGRGGRDGRGCLSSKPNYKATGGRGGSRFQDRQREQKFRGGKISRGGRGQVSDFHSKSSKESRGRAIHEHQRREPFRGGKHGNRGRDRVPEVNVRSSNKYQEHVRGRRFDDPYASNAPSGFGGRGPPSASKRQFSDLEPHAGYLGRPSKQRRDSFGQRRSGVHDRSGSYDDRSIMGTGYPGGSVSQPSYSSGYSGYHGYETGYSHPSGSQSYASHAGTYASHSSYPSQGGAYPPSGGYSGGGAYSGGGGGGAYPGGGGGGAYPGGGGGGAYPGGGGGGAYPGGGGAYAGSGGTYPGGGGGGAYTGVGGAYPGGGSYAGSGAYSGGGGAYAGGGAYSGGGAYPPNGAYTSTDGVHHPGGGSYPPNNGYYQR